MPQLFGDLLPTAIGIAVSPIPIVATILLLLTPKARTVSVAFLVGWLAGLVVSTSVFTLVGGSLPGPDPTASKPVLGVLQLALGVLAVCFAIVQWRKRPKDGVKPQTPKWMAGLGQLSPVAVLGIGAMLAVVNPKNLILAANAGISIGAAHLTIGQAITAIGFVVLIGGLTVLLPIIANLIWARQLRHPLVRLQEELQRDNAIIMAVLLLIIGAQMISKGFGHF